MLKTFEITPDMVKAKLNNVKTNKSPGADDIHPKLLYELRNELAAPLAKLYNQTFKEGSIPKDWKDANVTALYKNGSKTSCQNYRPVSLTSVVCKVMESLIKDKIVSHLETHSLVKNSQHGFLKGRSCLTNLLEFLEEVTYLIDQGKPADIIFLDFTEALI